MMSFRALLLSCFGGILLSGCMTFNASLQSAKVLDPEQSSHVLAGHLLEEVDRDVVKKRPFLDLGREFDPNTELPFFGLSYHYRHGWEADVDYGLSLSFGLSTADLKAELFDREGFAVAVGAKILVPTLSMIYFESYFAGIPLYLSYDITEGLSFYANPALYYGAARSREERFLEFSTGFILGNETGAVIEWSFVEDPASVSSFDRYRQFKLGYFWQNSPKTVQQPPRPLPIYPELGASIAPLPSLGLLKRWQIDGTLQVEAGLSFGYSPLAPTPGDIKRNFARSNFACVQLRWSDFGPFSLYTGLARRELGATLETQIGWQRIAAHNFGVTLGFGQSWNGAEIDWLGLYLPASFLPEEHEWKPLTEGLEEKSQSAGDLLASYRHEVSLQLLRYRILF